MTKKLRNRLLALICLLAFIGLGFVFFFTWVVQKPFAMILFVADGLDSGTLTAARIYTAGAEHPMEMESLPHLALLRNFSNDYAVPDPASAASAFATGQKVNNGSLAISPNGAELESILEAARRKGRATGIVSNVSLTDPGIAAFFTHGTHPKERSSFAASLVDRFSPDILFGGGEADFLPDIQGGQRTDGRNLVLEMRRKGYDIVRTPAELENTPSWRGGQVFALFSNHDLDFAGEIREKDSQPSLSTMVREAIQFLQFNQKGYLLVVSAGLMEKAARANESERVLREMQELDRAVQTALAYAGKKALIIVAGKQSVGGLRMNGYPLRSDKGLAALGINAQGRPSTVWATGPAGPTDLATPMNASKSSEDPADSQNTSSASENRRTSDWEIAAVFSPQAENIAQDTIALSIGPGSESLTGFIDHTRIYKVLHEGL